jgi:hypothetical protein
MALGALVLSAAACGDSSVVGGPTDSGTDLGPADTGPADTGPTDTGPADTGPTDTGPADAGPEDVAPTDAGPMRCTGPADCVGNAGGPACDTATGRCVPCTAADDRCPSGQYCTADNACAAGCRDDAACMAGDAGTGGRCDTATRQCVACVTNDHCAPGTLCVGNVCVMGCNTERPCPSAQTCCDGACVDTQSSIAACGACGNRCNVPNAMAACTNGTCTVGACTAPNANCDGMATNGCETNTQTDTAHCGACGTACATRPNATASCAAGMCAYTCAAGFADCDNDPSNGCEVDTRTSTAHCGACGRVCNPPNATAVCAMGQCGVAACTAGFGNCDDNPTNGCETDTRTSTSHCGACGTSCPGAPNAVPACTVGTCALTCAAGFADCDGNATNGCEVDTRTSATHCGACGRTCALANATAACAGSLCTVATCAAGFGDCDGNAANGCEADTRTSNTHCGACGTVCAAGQRCEAGACTRVVTADGCGLGDGGTPSGNALRRFCTLRGGVGLISGALGASGATTATLRIPTTALPAGSRIVAAMLYRLTYDRTTTYLTGLRLDGTDLAPRMRRIYVTPSGSPFEVVRADITQVVQSALPRATGGVLSLTVEQAPADSSGGYGWWIAYSANSLPERTVVVYDGGHTDTQSGNGAFAFEGFAVGPAPVTARVHLHGGGDSVGDAPSTGRFVTSRGVVTLNDITDPAAGNYAGTQNVDVASVLAPGDVRAAMDFGLRNYSGLGFAALEVNAPPVEACTPACASGEVCVGGQCRPGLGCGFGPRVGFTNTAAYPNVAACGSPLTWEEVSLSAATLCAPGWRLCTPADLNRAAGPTPDLAGPQAWVNYVDAATDRFGDYTVPACGGATPAVANLRGTAACTPSGTFPEGWRLAVTPSSWSRSHQTSAGCVEHTFHSCAYAGGSVAQARGVALCCRTP